MAAQTSRELTEVIIQTCQEHLRSSTGRPNFSVVERKLKAIIGDRCPSKVTIERIWSRRPSAATDELADERRKVKLVDAMYRQAELSTTIVQAELKRIAEKVVRGEELSVKDVKEIAVIGAVAADKVDKMRPTKIREKRPAPPAQNFLAILNVFQDKEELAAKLVQSLAEALPKDEPIDAKAEHYDTA